ncbi:hypothetical protein [Sphingobium limneticum]|jgi:hypothetical protein|uniref:hypothetical protein n=1 Tax=Sphingobium limneticum TaxID=1007511 RepID=UPI0031FBD756
MVAILFAPIGKGSAISMVACAIEQLTGTTLSVCPVALKVGQVSGKRGGAKVTATVTCDARLDEHPA